MSKNQETVGQGRSNCSRGVKKKNDDARSEIQGGVTAEWIQGFLRG